MSKYNFIYSLNNAIEGIIHSIKTQRHMKVHTIIALLVIIFALLLNISVTDMIIVLILIALVIGSELFNTAVEYLLDMLEKDFHITIKYIKDISAGAVLFNSIVSVFSGVMIFTKYLIPSEGVFLRENFIFMSLISVFLVVILVISLKAILHRGMPLKGGMPSGHSAISFSIWTAILINFDNLWLIMISLVIALIISFSRLWKGIHKGSEVFWGALLGSLITYLVFLLYEK